MKIIYHPTLNMADVCSICLEPLSPSPCTLLCGHQFDHACLLHAMLRGQATCPLCREPLYNGAFPQQHDDPQPQYNDGPSVLEPDVEPFDPQEHERRLLRKACRLVRLGKASSELRDEHEHWKRLVSRRKEMVAHERLMHRKARRFADICRQSINGVLRDQEMRGVRPFLHFNVTAVPHTTQYYYLLAEIQRVRKNVVELVDDDWEPVQFHRPSDAWS